MITVTPNLTEKTNSSNLVENNSNKYNLPYRLNKDIRFSGGFKSQKSTRDFISTLSDTFNFFLAKIKKSENGLSEKANIFVLIFASFASIIRKTQR